MEINATNPQMMRAEQYTTDSTHITNTSQASSTQTEPSQLTGNQNTPATISHQIELPPSVSILNTETSSYHSPPTQSPPQVRDPRNQSSTTSSNVSNTPHSSILSVNDYLTSPPVNSSSLSDNQDTPFSDNRISLQRTHSSVLEHTPSISTNSASISTYSSGSFSHLQSTSTPSFTPTEGTNSLINRPYHRRRRRVNHRKHPVISSNQIHSSTVPQAAQELPLSRDHNSSSFPQNTGDISDEPTGSVSIPDLFTHTASIESFTTSFSHSTSPPSSQASIALTIPPVPIDSEIAKGDGPHMSSHTISHHPDSEHRHHSHGSEEDSSARSHTTSLMGTIQKIDKDTSDLPSPMFIQPSLERSTNIGTFYIADSDQNNEFQSQNPHSSQRFRRDASNGTFREGEYQFDRNS